MALGRDTPGLSRLQAQDPLMSQVSSSLDSRQVFWPFRGADGRYYWSVQAESMPWEPASMIWQILSTRSAVQAHRAVAKS